MAHHLALHGEPHAAATLNMYYVVAAVTCIVRVLGRQLMERHFTKRSPKQMNVLKKYRALKNNPNLKLFILDMLNFEGFETLMFYTNIL